MQTGARVLASFSASREFGLLPPPCGGGLGWGVVPSGKRIATSYDPTPNPSRKGEGEHAEGAQGCRDDDRETPRLPRRRLRSLRRRGTASPLSPRAGQIRGDLGRQGIRVRGNARRRLVGDDARAELDGRDRLRAAR